MAITIRAATEADVPQILAFIRALAAYEREPDAVTASEADLLEWCRQKLAPYKAPRRIWIVEPGALPQNHTGKVLRRVLQEQFSQDAE